MDPETTPPTDLAVYVDAMATTLGLAIPESNKPGVVANVAHLWAIAEPVITFPLPDDLESAPTFEP
jgi:hypothetical protein